MDFGGQLLLSQKIMWVMALHKLVMVGLCAMTHWCAANDPQMCCGSLGEGRAIGRYEPPAGGGCVTYLLSKE